MSKYVKKGYMKMRKWIYVDINVKYCDLKDILKAKFVIFRCQICKKKTVHGNEKMNLPWAFKYYVCDSNVKYCDLKDFLKAQFVTFRCQNM